MKLRLATRGSALAWTQSGMVAEALRALGHEVELVKITTHGDVTTAPLASLGGAGVFVGAVRAALLSGEADLAVHSFKDLPTAPAEGLVLGAVPPRESSADALCSRGPGLADLPPGAKVGTGSPRRAAQLLALRPDLEIVEIRGNVETRLARIDTDLDAVVLAAAGLTRLGLAGRITEYLDAPSVLPAPAQGALAVERRTDAPAELRAALAAINDEPTRLSALAERAVLARLEAGCAAPVAARARVRDGMVHLSARVVAVDGSSSLSATGSAPADPADAVRVGVEVAERLLARGAGDLVNLAASKPKPLAGRRLLLPERCPAGLPEALRAAGAEVTLTAFTSHQVLGTTSLVAALREHWDWLVFSSPATISLLTEQGFDLERELRQYNIAAVGPATANALRAVGLEPDLVAFIGGGADLARQFPFGPGRVLLPGAEDASAEPSGGLRGKGWTVEQVAVYRTVALPLPAEIPALWAEVDAVIVTAGSVARAAVAAAGLPGPKVIAIGGSSATVSRELGLDVVAVAASPTTGGLVDAVLATFG